jgi:hypothetical protein
LAVKKKPHHCHTAAAFPVPRQHNCVVSEQTCGEGGQSLADHVEALQSPVFSSASSMTSSDGHRQPQQPLARDEEYVGLHLKAI